MFKRFIRTALMPLVFTVIFFILAIVYRNLVFAALAVVFLCASVFYIWQIYTQPDTPQDTKYQHLRRLGNDKRRPGENVRPLTFPELYSEYVPKDPVEAFFYCVAEKGRNIVIYFRNTDQGYRAFEAHARKPENASTSFVGRAGDPESLVNEIFAGKYESRDFVARDRLLTDRETACIQHLFDVEASAYKEKVKDTGSQSYVIRRSSRRVTSGTSYAFFMQFVLLSIADNGLVISKDTSKADVTVIVAPEPTTDQHEIQF